MLYFFYGSDKDTAREKVSALVENLLKKKPDAELFRVDPTSSVELATGEDPEKWFAARLTELAGSQGLFNNSYIVYLTNVLEDKEMKAVFLDRLEEIGGSSNIFVMLSGEVDKKTLLRITETAEKVQLFEKKPLDKLRAGKSEFNIFALTDAFGKRDKKSLWVLYQKAVASGAVSEEIHGILFWQLKSMLVAFTAKTAGEAGVAPFVFTKAKSFLKNYTEDELKKLSSTFVRMYHDAHRGMHDFEVALERLILTL